MEIFSINDLKLELDLSKGSEVHVVWTGKSNDRHPVKVLGPIFDRISALAQERSGKIAMHFEPLDYLNSSTISALIGFIQRAAELKVPLTITFADSVKWQKLCFDALRIFEKRDGLLNFIPTP